MTGAHNPALLYQDEGKKKGNLQHMNYKEDPLRDYPQVLSGSEGEEYLTKWETRLIVYKGQHNSRKLLAANETYDMDFKYFGRHTRESNRTYQRRKERATW